MKALRRFDYELLGPGPLRATDHLRPVGLGVGANPATEWHSLGGMGHELTAPGGRGTDARSALGRVLQSPVRGKVKTTIPFLQTRHLLEQGHKGRLWLDTDDPILGDVAEDFFEQQAQYLSTRV
jgi:hypothetical protein